MFNGVVVYCVSNLLRWVPFFQAADRGSSYEAEQEAKEREQQQAHMDETYNDNYMNEDDFFDGRQQQM